RIGGEHVGGRRFRAGDQAVEQDIVHDERGGATRLYHEERLRMILGRDDIEIEALLRTYLGDLLDVGRTGSRGYGLASQILDRLEIGGLLGDEAIGGDEMGDRESHLLLPLQIVGGGAAFKIAGAVGDEGKRGG